MRFGASVVLGLSVVCLLADDATSHGVHDIRFGDGTGYSETLESLARAIELHQERVSDDPVSWTPLESLAGAFVNRAHLTGDYTDFARAESLYARAFLVAPKGAGPFLARAQLHFSLHRLDRMEADLRAEERAIVIQPDVAHGLLALRADAAALSGEYAKAQAHFDALLAGGRDPGDLARVASFVWGLGLQDSSAALWNEAARGCAGCSPQFLAWLAAQQGDLETERGRFDAAAEFYASAQDRFPGWWFVYERQARLSALRGDRAAALFAYEELANRTNHPEMMDALAILLRESGDAGEAAAAARWVERAARLHEARMTRFPEAAIGHGLRHILRFSSDGARIVQLAERNRDLRPGGEARTLLAQAFWRAGRSADARREIESVLATRWSTPETHATAAVILGASPAAASRQRKRAEALSPWAMQLVAWLAPL